MQIANGIGVLETILQKHHQMFQFLIILWKIIKRETFYERKLICDNVMGIWDELCMRVS